MKNLLCPKCGCHTAACCHRDIGFIDYHDNYILRCDACGHTESQTVYGGSPTWDNWDTTCPFCGNNQREHSKKNRHSEEGSA